MKNYNNLKEPTYNEEAFGNNGDAYLASVSIYSPKWFGSSEEPEIKNFGVSDLGNCIGVVGWDPVTKTSYIHHIVNRGNNEDNDTVSKDRMVESLKYGLECGLSEFPDIPLSRYKFTLVTNNCFHLGMEAMVNLLQQNGVDQENITVDLHSSQILIKRESGELCKTFDQKKTKYRSPQEIELGIEIERQEAESRFSERLRREAFLAKPPEEKFAIFENQGLVNIEGNTLNIKLGPNDNKIEKEILQELLNYTQKQGVTSLKIKLEKPSSDSTYQKKLADIISCLEEIPAIKKLHISSETKLSFLSQNSTQAATQLAKAGKHLTEISLSANSIGAEAFSEALINLSQQGKLQEFKLTPIEGSWKAETQNKIEQNLHQANENIAKNNVASGSKVIDPRSLEALDLAVPKKKNAKEPLEQKSWFETMKDKKLSALKGGIKEV